MGPRVELSPWLDISEFGNRSLPPKSCAIHRHIVVVISVLHESSNVNRTARLQLVGSSRNRAALSRISQGVPRLFLGVLYAGQSTVARSPVEACQLPLST